MRPTDQMMKRDRLKEQFSESTRILEKVSPNLVMLYITKCKTLHLCSLNIQQRPTILIHSYTHNLLLDTEHWQSLKPNIH